MLVSIQHEIDLTHSAPISESAMDLHLVPRNDGHQTLRQFKLEIGPEVPVFDYLDWQENRVQHFSIVGSHDRSVIVANSTIDIHPQRWQLEQFDDSRPMLTMDHRNQDYLLPHGPVQFDPRLEQFAREVGLNRELRVSRVLAAVMTRLYAVVAFKRSATSNGRSSISEVLTLGEGGAQDCAHVALSLLRSLRIPARYVSGYLFRRGMAALDLHAWIEAFIPSVGWVGVDPTRGQLIGDSHIALAIGRSYLDVPLRRGAFRGAAEQSIKHALRRIDVQTDRRDEWFRTPRFDNRVLVELMMRDRLATSESLEQQLLQ